MSRFMIPLVVLLALPAATAHACSCAEPPAPTQALKDAAAVFTGQVVSADPDGANGFTYTVRVYAVWKGSSEPTVQVKTEDVAMCGLFMGVGDEFLVYALGELEALSTNNCTRSKLLDLAGSDLAELGEPVAVGVAEPSLSLVKARYP